MIRFLVVGSVFGRWISQTEGQLREILKSNDIYLKGHDCRSKYIYLVRRPKTYRVGDA